MKKGNKMKRITALLLAICVMSFAFTACGPQQSSATGEITVTGIGLSDEGITVGGTAAPEDSSAPVYVAKDIVFYLENQGDSYGEGETREEHSQQEADSHTVVHITQPGTYMITGTLSSGQIAVDLGENAKKNPDAVVNLILNNVNLTSTVAPAIVCYSAYECGSDDVETATKTVDTSAAGFNISLADGSVNNISGGHVAKIYKPGTEDKLHKYDAAIESMVSLNINGTDGVLNLAADNEGIETKLHMTVNGGILNINSTDDSLNAGEDGVSVITINGGRLLCNANNGLEGDGIDSNGWLVINDGSVSAFSSEKSMDSGLDSDNGIIINGGTVYATGTMYDRVSPESRQNTAVFSMDEWVFNEEYVVLKNSADETVAAFKSPSDHRTMIYSSPALTEGDYTLYKAEKVEGENINGVYTQVTEISGMVQLGHTDRGSFPGAGPGRPDRPETGSIKPEIPEFKKPEKWQEHEGSEDLPPVGLLEIIGDDKESERPQPEDFPGDENMPPEFDSERPEIDKNGSPVGFGGEGDFGFDTASLNSTFTVGKGFSMFSSVRKLPEE